MIRAVSYAMIGSGIAVMEGVFQITIPSEISGALIGLAVIAIGAFGLWLRNYVSHAAALQAIEIEKIKKELTDSKTDHDFVLRTATDLQKQVDSQAAQLEQQRKNDAERDRLLGAATANGESAIRERDRLAAKVEKMEEIQNKRHEEKNKLFAEVAEGLTAVLEFQRRTEAAEQDRAKLQGDNDKLRAELAALRGPVSTDNGAIPQVDITPAPNQ